MLNIKSNYLEKYSQITPQNIEWSLIQYKLQLNLGNSSAYLKKVYCVANPQLNKIFENASKGSIISQVYIKSDLLTQSNRIQRVCQKGFEFPSSQKGIVFKMGQIQIDPLQRNNDDYEVLVVKICPRKSYPCLKNSYGSNIQECPQGFDSIYYPQSSENQEIYSHKFRLFKKGQALPYYVIHFSFKSQHQKKLKSIICQNCQDEVSKFYCVTQKIYFCKKCDYQHHKNKISAQHQRIEYVHKPVLDFGFCRYHKSNKNELFCKKCNYSMCMSCKIYGDHSEGQMATHSISKIEDYYEGTTKRIDEMDPNLQRRKDQLQQLLQFVDGKMSQVNNQSSKVQKQLNDIFQQSLRSLKSIVHRKLSYLISDQFQIRRQYDYIQWMESFLKYQYQVLSPNDFLIVTTKHSKLRKQVLNLSNIPPITDVKTDFLVEGRLSIKQGEIIVGGEFYENEEEKRLGKRTQIGKDSQGTERTQNDFRKKIFFREQPTSSKDQPNKIQLQ